MVTNVLPPFFMVHSVYTNGNEKRIPTDLRAWARLGSVLAAPILRDKTGYCP